MTTKKTIIPTELIIMLMKSILNLFISLKMIFIVRAIVKKMIQYPETMKQKIK
jgi:hypothetical protein